MCFIFLQQNEKQLKHEFKNAWESRGQAGIAFWYTTACMQVYMQQIKFSRLVRKIHSDKTINFIDWEIIY